MPSGGAQAGCDGRLSAPLPASKNASHSSASPVKDQDTDATETRYSQCFCWGRRTLWERTLAAACLALLVVCSALVLVNILLDAKLRVQLEKRDRICSSKECITSAATLLEKMDTSTDPCEDFYQFACGSYLTKNTVPDDHYHRSLIQTMQDDIFVILKKLLEDPIKSEDSEAIVKVKRLYSSCMNTSSVEDGSIVLLLDLLTDAGIGEWPVLNKSWSKPRVNLEWMLAILHVYEVQPFFHTFVAPDDRNSSVYLLHLYAGSPILNNQYYLNSTDSTDHELYLAAYRDMILETLRLLSADPVEAARDVQDMIAFERAFANLTQITYDAASSPASSENATSQGDDDFQFNRMNISQLEDIVPEIKWSLLVKYIFDQVGISYVNVDLNVVVHCELYLQHLMALIQDTTPRTVKNYLVWRFVVKYMPYLDIHFRRLYYDFRRQVPNLSEDRTFFARWKECVSVVNDGFGMALAALYVKHQVQPAGTDKEVQAMVSSVKKSFIEMLLSQNWLDSATQLLCKEKVEMMGEKIGHPHYILDPGQLDSDFAGLDIADDHFLSNILWMNRYEVIKELLKMTRPVDKERDWFVEPLVVNAFYEATGNAVIFPVGILRAPVFHPDRPRFLNYGTLGVVIGHEITHGFDNSGRRFDKAGNMSQWWSDEITEKFKELSACFVDQYASYPVEAAGQNMYYYQNADRPGHTRMGSRARTRAREDLDSYADQNVIPIRESSVQVNGNLTLDENICDNTGLRVAFKAYQESVHQNGEEARLPGVDFTNEQIFFLRYAQIWCEVVSKEGYERYLKDNHSPGRYRANGALVNSVEFSSTFNCPLGSPMNPVKKCRLWG